MKSDRKYKVTGCVIFRQCRKAIGLKFALAIDYCADFVNLSMMLLDQ